jgi:hypothetical protein
MDMEKQELSFIAGGNVKWQSHFEKEFVSFLKRTKYIVTTNPANFSPWNLFKGVENVCLHRHLNMDV